MNAALTILACTHNRADLLERVLASLNAVKRPPDWRAEAKPGKSQTALHAINSMNR